MAYYREFADTPAGEVLKAIQLRGQASIKDLATDMGVTRSTVRQHLLRLQARGAIRVKQVREGVGRPYHVYSATPQAHNLFQNDYGELTQLLLKEIASTQGGEALQRLLRRVSDRLAARYREQIRGQELADQLTAWAELLDKKGVTVEIKGTEDGYVLQEHGCPYQSVATENRAVCEMERQVMARLLESSVELTKCILDGHPRCQFTVTELRAQETRTPGKEESTAESQFTTNKNRSTTGNKQRDVVY
jgi:predicted ArsR family transcriptional regulator